MAKAVHRSGLKRPRAALALGLLLAIPALGGCLVIRETRQRASQSVLLDGPTRLALSEGMLLVRADRGKANRVVHHRYHADETGTVSAPEIRGWTAVVALPLPRNVVGEWRNEHTYLAPGHAWLRLPIGPRTGGRAPERVLLEPLPAGAPRPAFGMAERRTWSGLDTWEIALPVCQGYAQGLREGDGRVIYWDPQRVIMAATLEVAEDGFRFADSPRLVRVQVIENGKTKKPRRVFLDARSCTLAFDG